MLGGVRATELAREFGTPVVVYDEATLQAQARAYAAAAPGALVVYGTKAFPSIAVLQLFAGEGLGADVSTVGELEFARRAGISGDRLVIHGNNKEDELLHGSVEAGALIVLDSLDELERARALGAKRCLIRVTPGIEADTHEAVKTAHHGSKFGLPPDDAIEALRRLPDCLGLHVHVGSQLHAFRSRVDDGRLGRPVRGARAARARLDTADRRPRRRPRRAPCGRGAVVHGRRVRRRPRRRARPRIPAAEPARPVARARARPLARLPGRRDALHRRRRQARERRDDVRDDRRRDVGQPAARDVRRALHGAARESRRGGADGGLRRRRQALRVGRRADRASRAACPCARRPARRAGHRRVHARDELDLQRRPAPARCARRGRRARG